MKTNALKFAVFVGVLVTLQTVEERFGNSFTNVAWEALLAVDICMFAICGAIAFLVFSGSTGKRFALVFALPIVANALLELFVGSDRAYPHVLLLLSIPYALAFVVGAAVVALYERYSGKSRGIRN